MATDPLACEAVEAPWAAATTGGNKAEGARWRRPAWAVCPTCDECGGIHTARDRCCGYTGPPPAIALPDLAVTGRGLPGGG